MSDNVKLRKHFTQVCVWPGCVVGPDEVAAFVKVMREKFGVRVQYLEEIETGPDTDSDGHPVEGTGGRNDLFFAVHEKDVSGSFCIQRLTMGIRWIEDVLAPGNYDSKIYPARVHGYCSWDAGNEDEDEDAA